MKAELLSVGTELLLGEIVDTNSAYLARSLQELGIDLYWMSTVGDNMGRLLEVLQRAWSRSDLIICTGGVGPTDDDMTREGIANLFGEEMAVQPELAEHLRAFFRRRGYEMPARNIKQATLIPSARALANPIGTAPGWWAERDGRVVIAMPGVPSEMTRMWENEALPELRRRQGAAVILTKTLKVVGVGESAAEDMIRELVASPNPTVATYAKSDGVHIRIGAKSNDPDEAQQMVCEMEAKVRAILGVHIYGCDNETLEAVVGAMLRERGLSLATMESCTGGELANLITDVPGSSDYFLGGFVAYSPEMKVSLGVDPEAIARHGVVSAETAIAMAKAARQRTGADAALSTTGVAGREPVDGVAGGTMFLGLDLQGKTKALQQVATVARPVFKARASAYALNLLRRSLLE
ncbi:MAG: competence/damage-inducible protein A [Chloroflexi bacterium]|nr:competence/damage-inducible protein A [Chloroflexota bacterium]